MIIYCTPHPKYIAHSEQQPQHIQGLLVPKTTIQFNLSNQVVVPFWFCFDVNAVLYLNTQIITAWVDLSVFNQ